MRRTDARSTLPSLLAVVLTASCGLAAAGGRKTWDFENDAPGRIAAGFAAASGSWEVAEVEGQHVLYQKARNEDRTFNVALVEGTGYRDLDIQVRLRADSGKNDQGGGIVWRARDARNYYIARYNPLEDNLRVYKVEDGKRTQLDHADAPGDRGWHTLRITMKGREILGYLDGKRLLVAEDSTFPDAGMIGVWTKADAQTYFDDLAVDD